MASKSTVRRYNLDDSILNDVLTSSTPCRNAEVRKTLYDFDRQQIVEEGPSYSSNSSINSTNSQTEREICNVLVDSNKALLNELSSKNDIIASLKKEVLELKTANEKLEQKLSKTDENKPQTERTVSNSLRKIVSQLTDEEKFNPQENITSTHNQQVMKSLKIHLKDIHSYQDSVLESSLKKRFYYERKCYKEEQLSGPERDLVIYKRKVTSRRQQLYNRRLTTADKQKNDTALSLLHNMSYNDMSDMDDGEGDCYIRKTPSWRNAEHTAILRELDVGVNAQKKIIEGTPSKRTKSCVLRA